MRTSYHLALSRWLIRFIQTPISALCSIYTLFCSSEDNKLKLLTVLPHVKQTSPEYVERRTGEHSTLALYYGYLSFKPMPKAILDCQVFRSSSQGLQTSAEHYLKLCHNSVFALPSQIIIYALKLLSSEDT
jgi:hypothetical protein